MAEAKLSKIFCVVDPTTTKQRALTRAASIATDSGATVHAFLSFNLPALAAAADEGELIRAEHERHSLWLDSLLAPLREQGISCDSEVLYDEDWRDAIVQSAKRVGADLIVRASYQRSKIERRVLKTTDWTLLREAPCPVLLVKTDRVEQLSTLMVAVNLNAKDEAHQHLNDLAIQFATDVAKQTNADLHAVNSYIGSFGFVHPPDLARRVGIDRSRAHVAEGSPEEVVAEQAKAVGAQLVIIGSKARTGLSGLVVGNTAERILDRVSCDVLCLLDRSA